MEVPVLAKVWGGILSVRRRVVPIRFDTSLRARAIFDVGVTLLMAAFEEGFKHLLPGGALILALAEMVVLAVKHKSLTSEDLIGGVFRVGAHVGLSLLPFGLGWLIHVAYNLTLRALDPASPVNQWLQLTRLESKVAAIRREDVRDVEMKELPVSRPEPIVPVTNAVQVIEDGELPNYAPITVTMDSVTMPLTQRLADFIHDSSPVKSSGVCFGELS